MASSSGPSSTDFNFASDPQGETPLLRDLLQGMTLGHLIAWLRSPLDPTSVMTPTNLSMLATSLTPAEKTAKLIHVLGLASDHGFKTSVLITLIWRWAATNSIWHTTSLPSLASWFQTINAGRTPFRSVLLHGTHELDERIKALKTLEGRWGPTWFARLPATVFDKQVLTDAFFLPTADVVEYVYYARRDESPETTIAQVREKSRPGQMLYSNRWSFRPLDSMPGGARSTMDRLYEPWQEMWDVRYDSTDAEFLARFDSIWVEVEERGRKFWPRSWLKRSNPWQW